LQNVPCNASSQTIPPPKQHIIKVIICNIQRPIP